MAGKVGGVAAALLVLFGASVAGCATPPIDANTLCSDFMKLDQGARDRAVLSIASQRENPDVVTPLGRPNVEYQCTQSPNLTVGQVIDTSRFSAKNIPRASNSPNPTPTSKPIFTHSWTDEDGYSFQADVFVGTISTKIDTQNAKPGKAWVSMTVPVSLNTTNATPGRNAPSPSAIAVAPVWTTSSPVCQLQGEAVYFVAIPSGKEGDGFCVHYPAAQQFSVSKQRLAPGEAAVSSGPRELHYDFVVSEAEVSAFAATLANPAGWILTMNDYGPRTCLIYNYQDLTDRLVKATVHIPKCGV